MPLLQHVLGAGEVIRPAGSEGRPGIGTIEVRPEVRHGKARRSVTVRLMHHGMQGQVVDANGVKMVALYFEGVGVFRPTRCFRQTSKRLRADDRLAGRVPGRQRHRHGIHGPWRITRPVFSHGAVQLAGDLQAVEHPVAIGFSPEVPSFRYAMRFEAGVVFFRHEGGLRFPEVEQERVGGVRVLYDAACKCRQPFDQS